jgi:translation initiation factor 2 subunit 1
MYYHKTGLPEESEIVMCTVTNIQYSSIFANIDDYNVSGMIHISEIAAGRIRNIRDYVKEGKKIVCKVLRIYPEKGHVDLSLRRVNERERKNKVNDVKFEQKAESIIDHVAKENKLDPKKIYEELIKHFLKDYGYLYHAFEDIVAGNLKLESIGMDPKIAVQIEELVNQRFKPQSIEISGVLSLTSYDGNGLEIVKETLEEAQKTEGVEIRYLGGGKYSLSVKGTDYKEAEPVLKEASESALEYIKKHKGIGEFKRGTIAGPKK